MADDTINVEVHSLAPSAVIELYVVEPPGAPALYFHAGTNGLRKKIVWDGISYQFFPVEFTDFEISGQGLLPTPTFRVANVGGVITASLLASKGFIGAKVTRKRTLQKFLDADNFPVSVGNPDADPNAAFPDEIFFVEQKINEDPTLVEFRLVSALDLETVKLPGRQITANLCLWTYGDASCGFTGDGVLEWDSGTSYDPSLSDRSKWIVFRGGKRYRAIVSNSNKDPLTNPDVWKPDFCKKTFAECKFHHPSPFPFGCFPGAARVPQV